MSMCQPSSVLFILFFTQVLVGYVEPNNIVCPPGKAQFPNPNDRYSFYKCDAGGNPILFTCPAKTWFNPCLEVCDWDTGNYNCRKSDGTGNPSNQGNNGNGNTADKYPSGSTNNGSGNSNNVINININIHGDQTGGNKGKPNNTNTVADGNRPQDPSQNGQFPNQPIPPSHGGYRPQPNSPTTEGTTTANYQDYPTKLAPNQTCSSYGAVYQNPDDCSTYFMCNQRLVLVHCPQGYFYIPENKRCETSFPSGCKFV